MNKHTNKHTLTLFPYGTPLTGACSCGLTFMANVKKNAKSLIKIMHYQHLIKVLPAAKKPLVILTMEGGIVQQVDGFNLPNDEINVVVLDFDTDGADPKDLYTANADGEQCFVHVENASRLQEPEFLAPLFVALQEEFTL